MVSVPIRTDVDCCPNCGGPLAYYSQLGIYVTLCFCPKCELVATSWMSFPYRCKNCDSELHYSLKRASFSHESDTCWWCRGTEFYTPPKGSWNKKDLRPGNYMRTRQLEKCTSAKDGRHDLKEISNRAEVRDAAGHLTVWPLTQFKCNGCGIEIYTGY